MFFYNEMYFMLEVSSLVEKSLRNLSHGAVAARGLNRYFI